MGFQYTRYCLTIMFELYIYYIYELKKFTYAELYNCFTVYGSPHRPQTTSRIRMLLNLPRMKQSADRLKLLCLRG